MLRGMDPVAALERVCTILGSYVALGALFEPPVSPQGVQKWLKGGLPPARVIVVAQGVGYRVTPHDLRPDIYPHPDDGLPEQARGRATA